MEGFKEYLRGLKTLSEKSIEDDMSRINSMKKRNIDFTKGEAYVKEALEKSDLSVSTISSCLRLCRRYSEYITKNKMNYIEAIEKRMSRRTYLQMLIDEKSQEAIKNLINDINKKSNLSIEFIENGKSAFESIKKSYGLFKGVCSLIALKGLKSDIHLKEKSGYYGEAIALKATEIGLGTCWVGGTFDRKDSVFNLSENEELICVITIGNVTNESRFKEKMIYKLVHRKTKTLEEMYTSDVTAPKWFITAMESVQKAPSALNAQKVKFDYKEGVVRASVPNTYTADLIDLGIAKLHFELASNGHFNLGNNSVYNN